MRQSSYVGGGDRMIWLWPMHFATPRHAQSQFCYFYQHMRYPDLRGGAYLADIVKGLEE